jgi:CDGSH-type Zn-finger protein
VADEPAVITAYENGPLLVRGDFTLIGADGEPIERRRPVVALCRCGNSAIKPFCDGTHKVTGFRT